MVLSGTRYNLAQAITKSDTVNFDGSTYSATAANPAKPCDAIYVGGAGIVVAILNTGAAVSFTCVAGALLPIAAIRVNSTTTTATVMVALYSV